MKRRRRWPRAAAVLALLACGAGAFVAWRGRSPAVPAGWTFRVAPGTVAVYELRHRTAMSVSLGESGGLAGGDHLEGELRLRALAGYEEGGARVAASFAGLTRHEVNVLGQNVLADPAAARAQLEGHEAVVRFAADGTVEGVSVPRQAPPLFGNVMQLALADVSVTVRAGQRRWRAGAVSPRGTVDMSVEVTRRRGATFTVAGTHERYTRLEGFPRGAAAELLAGRLVAELRDEGRVESLQSAHRARVQGPRGNTAGELEVEASLQFLRTEDASSEEPRDQAAVALGALARGPDLEAALLDQKIEGLTGAELLSLLERFGGTGVVPDHNRFLVRAVSLLRKQPELCGVLVELFTRPDTSLPGKLLVLDLFMGAGTPPAQQALLKALDTRSAREAAAFPEMLSRVALVSAPTAETQAWSEATYRARRGGTAALALGAVAGRRAHAARDVESARILGELARDLERAEGVDARTDLLAALGNAGAPELVGAVTRWAGDESPDVRRAAADALRATQTRESEAALLRLSADRAAGVQGTALGALGHYALDGALLGRLRDEALPAIAPQNQQRLITLVAPYAASDAAARDILSTLAADPRGDAQTRTRARKLLAPHLGG